MFQYDSNGNLVRKSGPSGIIHYVYDSATQRHTETWAGTSYADAVTDIVYGYNSMGELASVTVLKENGQPPAVVQSSAQYNAAGGKSTTTLPNTVYTYDLGGRLTNSFNSATGITTTYNYKPNTNYISQETVTHNLSPVTLAVYSYAYRADGLKTGAVEYSLNADGSSDTVTLSWSYDALDRLISERSSATASTAALNYTDSYAYDLDSNRVQETTDNTNGTDTITSTYNANDELTQTVDANNGTTTYSYDSNGSQMDVSSPTGQIQLQLNGAFQVTDAISGSSPTSYDVKIYDSNSHLLWENDVSAAAEPPGVWNGLALTYSLTAILNHDANGNIIGLNGSYAGPLNILQNFWQAGITSDSGYNSSTVGVQ